MGSDPIVPSLLSLPCADAQGWYSTPLDNARKFRMKFTVADPSDAVVIMSDTVVPHFVVAFLKWFMVPFAVSAGSERPKTLAG